MGMKLKRCLFPDRLRWRGMAGGVALAVVLFASGLGIALAEGTTSGAELARHEPGALLRIWPLEGGAPNEAKAYRILYRSVGLNGKPIAVTGAVMFPAGEAPRGSRNVIAWAHPTSGVVTRCAPSLMPDLAGSIQGLAAMLDAQHVVVATDYVGLGTNDTHPYLVGISAARAVIDSVRAARHLKDSGAGPRFAVWGHSQGGHAALYTGEHVRTYAPELELVGVAAAAPATYLVDLFEADRNTSSGRSLTAMALLSWSRFFKLPLDDIVEPGAYGAFRRLASDCIETIDDFLKEGRDEKKLEKHAFLKADPTTLPAWRGIMDRNTPGRSPSAAPIFLAQGTADQVVRPHITQKFKRAACAHGTRVKLHLMKGVSHMFAGRDSADAAVRWMAERFNRKPPPNDC
jgi:acetyl esterase/lipase